MQPKILKLFKYFLAGEATFDWGGPVHLPPWFRPWPVICYMSVNGLRCCNKRDENNHDFNCFIIGS